MGHLQNLPVANALRRTEKDRTDAELFKCLPVLGKFFAQLFFVQIFQMSVGKGMTAHTVSFGDCPFKRLRIVFRILPNDKKGCFHLVFLQNIQNFICIARMRTVVKGQGNFPAFCRAGSIHMVFLVIEIAAPVL